MRLIDLTFPTPEENLAFDEALLNSVEAGETGEVLRCWESAVPFVVLGVAQPVAGHVLEDACQADGIPILRRCSAGGCVIQGPGSFNYTLVLRYDRHPDAQTIRGSYCYILGRLSAALANRGIPARHCGVSDLAIHDRKISGNAQRRRKHAFLHHGTLLYGPENACMERYLLEPQDRPGYRGPRPHRDFITRLPLGPAALRALVAEAFARPEQTPEPPTDWELQETERLLAAKYRSRDWHHRR
jgi:lipoate---protein ligase